MDRYWVVVRSVGIDWPADERAQCEAILAQVEATEADNGQTGAIMGKTKAAFA